MPVEEDVLEFWRVVCELLALHIEVYYVLEEAKHFISSLAHSHNLHQILHLVHPNIETSNNHFFG